MEERVSYAIVANTQMGVHVNLVVVPASLVLILRPIVLLVTLAMITIYLGPHAYNAPVRLILMAPNASHAGTAV